MVTIGLMVMIMKEMMMMMVVVMMIYVSIYLFLIFKQGDSLSPTIVVFHEALLNIMKNNDLKKYIK